MQRSCTKTKTTAFFFVFRVFFNLLQKNVKIKFYEFPLFIEKISNRDIQTSCKIPKMLNQIDFSCYRFIFDDFINNIKKFFTTNFNLNESIF